MPPPSPLPYNSSVAQHLCSTEISMNGPHPPFRPTPNCANLDAPPPPPPHPITALWLNIFAAQTNFNECPLPPPTPNCSSCANLNGGVHLFNQRLDGVVGHLQTLQGEVPLAARPQGHVLLVLPHKQLARRGARNVHGSVRRSCRWGGNSGIGCCHGITQADHRWEEIFLVTNRTCGSKTKELPRLERSCHSNLGLFNLSLFMSSLKFGSV